MSNIDIILTPNVKSKCPVSQQNKTTETASTKKTIQYHPKTTETTIKTKDTAAV